ncbi:holo-ACP synthase [bacterium]
MNIGVDIVEIERIKNLIETKENFLQRLFSPEEIKYCNQKKLKEQNFAARFAAKEAVIKALNDKSIPLNSISIQNEKSGKPVVKLSGKWKKFEEKISISLSHSDKYAVAFIIYKEG